MNYAFLEIISYKKFDKTNILNIKLMLRKFYNENFKINYKLIFTSKLKKITYYKVLYTLNYKNI